MFPSHFFFDRIVKTYDGKFIFTKTLEGTAWIKVWSRTLPEGRIFRVWMILSSKFVLVDDEGQKWAYYPLYKTHELQKKHFWSLPCQTICKCLRPHLTCLWCPYRRILTKGEQNPIPCTIYLDVVPNDRPLSFLRVWLISKLDSLKEFVAHW